jgi:hypothetical protein
MARPRVASRSELTKLGLEVLGEDVSPGAYEVRMVKAIAAMLAASKVTKKARVDETKLAVPPRQLFEAIRRDAGDKILCEPIDARWFGRLGGALKALPSFGPADVELLTSWLNAGGQATWPQGVPTFDHLIRNLDKWTAFAREWDRRGRQTLGGKRGAVGSPSTAESSDFSAFMVPKL